MHDTFINAGYESVSSTEGMPQTQMKITEIKIQMRGVEKRSGSREEITVKHPNILINNQING